MTLYKWSQIAASDATADPSINWQEGQAPSSVNDSGRAMMAAVAKYRDDTSGSLIMSGSTSTAYVLTTNQPFSSSSELNGQELSFVVSPTNGQSPTLNVNSIGSYPLVTTANVAIPAGSLIDGSIYTATFSNSLNCWKLRGFYVNPYNVPLRGMLDYIGLNVPNSNFVFPTGQAISRTTYATLFSLVGTIYGTGDGSTTFNVPDLTGRVTAMKEASVTRLTSTYFGGNSTTLGAVGGLESHTLTTAQLASHSHANTLADAGHSHGTTTVNGASAISNAGGALGFGSGSFNSVGLSSGILINSSTTGITITNASAGSGSAPNNVQPTIICNRILRII